MDDSSKYLIHAEIRADGVVERNDVVGAVYGQTEGLLGEELDLRTLQRSSKIGRIDVEIEAAGGQSVGGITVATSLDKVETATLAAALETIDRVGPCRASVEVVDLEDVRAAKRRRVVDRARELLLEEFQEASSEAIVEEVRRQVELGEVESYEGLPAGPGVPDTDAVVVVEGRSDVAALLEAGIGNAIAVEGTDVPDAVAALTAERMTTTFLDGDRGGDLILRELAQVGDVDYVSFAPAGRSVEDLSASEIRTALRDKVPYEAVADAASPREAIDDVGPASSPDPGDPTSARAGGDDGRSADGGTATADPGSRADAEPADAAEPADPPRDPNGDGTPSDPEPTDAPVAESDASPEDGNQELPNRAIAAASAEGSTVSEVDSDAVEDDGSDSGGLENVESDAEPAEDDATDSPDEDDEPAETQSDEDGQDEPTTIQGHADAVIRERTGRVRLLDGEFRTVAEAPAEEAFDAVESADPVPAAVVLDGALSQRLLDVAAQSGVRQVVAADYGSFTKRPTAVRIRTAEELFAT